MKKTFQLTASNKAPQRVIESIKHEIRKYIKREKNKKLPDGFDMWIMDCKFAQDENEPKEIRFVDITKSIDMAQEENAKTIYVELVSKAVKKEKKEEISSTEELM